MEADEKKELIRIIGELNSKIYDLNQDEEKKELISIIGDLNNIIYDMKQESKQSSQHNRKSSLSFAKLGENSPISSNSAVDFLEIERNAMNEGYESEIRSLKSKIEEDKANYEQTIEHLQSQINQLNEEKAEIQENLVISAQTIQNLNETIDEQNSKNLLLQGEKELIQANIPINQSDRSELISEYGKLAQENQNMKKQIEDLSNHLSLFESQLKNQQEINQKDRHFYSSEIQRLTELSSSQNVITQPQFDESRLLEENKQLKQNYDSMAFNYNKLIAEKMQIQNEMIENRKEFAQKIKSEQEQAAECLTLSMSLKSLLGIENTNDILSEINRIYNEYQHFPIREKTEQDLRSEIQRQNSKIMQLQSIIDTKPLYDFPITQKAYSISNDSSELLKLKSENNQIRIENENLTQTLNSKEKSISEQKETIEKLTNENDELRGNVLLREESIHELQCKIEDLTKTQENQPHENYESQIHELTDLIEKLTEENKELKQPNEITDVQSKNLLNLIQRRLFFISESMKQRISNPTPAIENLVQLLNEIILLDLETANEASNQQFEVDSISIIDQMNADNQTLAYCIQQLTNAYQQSVSYTKFMKIIYKQIEELNTRIDGMYENVFTKLGYHNNKQETSFAASTGYEVPDDMEIMSLMQNQKRIPRTPDQPTTSFVSLLDSPHIQRNADENQLQTKIDSNPKSTSSSRIPKFNPPKNGKLRKPLAVRQNNADPKLMSPRMAPSHIPEPTRNKNKFF